MNDELSNQLCDQWRIPSYAWDKIWVTTEFDSVLAEGELGVFRLSVPSPVLTLRWGAPDGVGLVKLRWHTDSIGWTGEVRVGGSVDAMHFIGAEDEDTTMALVLFSGQVLEPMSPYPALGSGAVQSRGDFFSGVDREDQVMVTPWLVNYHSPLFALCQDAMANKLNAYIWGGLTRAANGSQLLTPFSLYELTLFAT